jgi:insertion element IS1 protein InsB
LILECDELWSFVGHKGNKQWLWLALDANSRETVALFVGDRSEQGAQGLWAALPADYRQRAVCYTDHWEAYAAVIPKAQHRPVDKASGKTNHLERFNNTLRQRVARLVRKTLSFSKKLDNHVGAIWYFIHHYNASLSVSTPSSLLV